MNFIIFKMEKINKSMKTKIQIIESKKTSEPFGGFENRKPILIDKSKVKQNLYIIMVLNIYVKILSKIFAILMVKKKLIL